MQVGKAFEGGYYPRYHDNTESRAREQSIGPKLLGKLIIRGVVFFVVFKYYEHCHLVNIEKITPSKLGVMIEESTSLSQ